jgi:hypothetical protein
MNLDVVTSDERLRLWKELRKEIKDLSLDESFKKIIEFIEHTPVGTRTVDYYDSKSWPGPWEILFYGSFCTSSISLLIYHTLELTHPNIKDLKIYCVADTTDTYLLPVIDNHYVLNYNESMVNTLLEVEEYLEFKEEFDLRKLK